MPRYKLTLEYDGTPFYGWQRQDNLPTVQGSLEAAIKKFSGEEVHVQGAGRTDAGVHATKQVAHVDLDRDFEPFAVMSATNQHMKSEPVVVVNCEQVKDEFNARFSAKKRAYRYRIINRRTTLTIERDRAWLVIPELDEHKMQQAADMLVGTHDFSSFRDSLCQAKSPVKTLDVVQVSRHGDEIAIVVEAQSFLHHMVRIIVGSLCMVGKGKWTLDDFKHALEACDRKAGGPTAAACGLYLTEVLY